LAIGYFPINFKNWPITIHFGWPILLHILNGMTINNLHLSSKKWPTNFWPLFLAMYYIYICKFIVLHTLYSWGYFSFKDTTIASHCCNVVPEFKLIWFSNLKIYSQTIQQMIFTYISTMSINSVILFIWVSSSRNTLFSSSSSCLRCTSWSWALRNLNNVYHSIAYNIPDICTVYVHTHTY